MLISRLIGLVVMLDGAVSARYGHAFTRWLKRRTPGPLHAMIIPFELVPEPLFRMGALLQAAAGAHLLVRGSLPGQAALDREQA